MKIRDRIVAFASGMDIIDMNRISLRKTIDMLKKSDETHQKVVNYIKNAGLYLEDCQYQEEDEAEDLQEVSDAVNDNLADMRLQPERLRMLSVYKGIPLSGVLDSAGTKKTAALASYVIDALKNGCILLIDDLNSSLHVRLTRTVIALFNNELNERAQLIAAAHDSSLLDCQTLFRKEQIWFTHKDRENVYLYSLADFAAEETGVRDTYELIRKYREGVFGALSAPDLFPSLMEIKKRG